MLLWPVLGTNYGGFPPRTATFITALALLATYAVFGVALMIGYGLLTSRAPMRQPAPVDAPTARRAVLLGGFGVVVAVVAGTLMRRLYDVATFGYDGTQYRGADIQPITLLYVSSKLRMVAHLSYH